VEVLILVSFAEAASRCPDIEEIPLNSSQIGSEAFERVRKCPSQGDSKARFLKTLLRNWQT